MRRAASIVLLMMVATAAAASRQPREHQLALTPANVHWGYYDARIAPVLRITSGDRVRIDTMIAGGLQRVRLAGGTETEIPEALKAVEQGVTERGPGAHPMTGPIFVEGAAPGDTLEIRILEIDFLHPFGIIAFSPTGGTLPEDFPYAHVRLLRWAPGATRVDFTPGVSLPFAPFFGSIAVAPPPLVGRLSSRPPGWHGGNLDNKDLVAGTTLYLPVHVTGAHLSVGDGHAMQGHGEVSGTALETSLRGRFEVRVRKGPRLRWPRAETPTHFVAMGLHEDLDEAARLATRELIDFLVAEKGLSRDDAYTLCSLAADLHVTQVVDGTKGIHATIAKSLFK
jgi:acetamidase/formamidase